MKSLDSFIISDAGEKTHARIFEPLFLTVQPALQSRAELIRIVAKGMDVSAEFVREGKLYPLKVHKDYHPGIISSRIRVVSGMSIVPEEMQTGSLQLGHNGHCAKADVEIRRIANQEVISMELSWAN